MRILLLSFPTLVFSKQYYREKIYYRSLPAKLIKLFLSLFFSLFLSDPVFYILEYTHIRMKYIAYIMIIYFIIITLTSVLIEILITQLLNVHI